MVSKNNFKFNLYGVRVPTILFSPWVPMGTVFRAPAESAQPFDHTSFIKTFLQWAGADLSKAGFFNRMPAAPTFDQVLLRSDAAASDNAAAIQARYPAVLPPSPELEPSQTINHLFEGIGCASVRTIIATSKTPEEMLRKIDEYRRDPAAFERSLTAS
jgi:phospholipase C